MANRNINTDYFKGAFVRSLTAASKLFYLYAFCECSPSGIWFADLKIASAYLDINFSEEKFIIDFVKSGKAIPLFGGRYFFPDFIYEQYPKGLSATNPAHKNVIETLKRYELIGEDLQLIAAPKVAPLLEELRSYKWEEKREAKEPEFIHAPALVGLNPKAPDEKKEKKAPKLKKDQEQIDEAMQKRMEQFRATLLPYVEQYGEHMLFAPGEFFSYWTQPNRDKKTFQMEQHRAWSLPHRLATWKNRYKGPGASVKPQGEASAFAKFTAADK